MNATANGKPKKPISEAAKLKQDLAIERMRRELAQERVTRRMLESTTYYTEDGRRVVQPREVAEPALPGERVVTQGRSERKLPFANLEELAVIRNSSRWLADENMYTCGMLGVLESYVVGTGFSYRVVAKERKTVDQSWLLKGQDVIDEFLDRSVWWDWERELFRREHRDGDELRRYFVGSDNRLVFRPVEPEHLVDPPGIKHDDPEWSMGVRRKADDPYTILGYWIAYDGNPAHGVEVPASEIDHRKANVDKCIPRGLSDFFVVKDIAVDLLKLITNVNRGAQVLAAIAWIESQAPGVLKSEVEAMAGLEAEYTQTNPLTSQTDYYQRLKPGSKIRTNAGKTYNAAPLAQNTMNFVEIVRLCRQALGARWSASEILTGDASNANYASSIVAESPFVHRATTEQYSQAQSHRMTMFRALRLAEAAGKLPSGFCDNVDVQVEPPAITGRKPAEEAAADEIEQRLGIVSPQTQADRRGYNWEREQEQILKAKALGWMPAGAAVAGPVAMQALESAANPFWWLREVVA